MDYTLTLVRKYKKDKYTIGNLYDEDGNFLCNTLEDTDRGLSQSMTLPEIKQKKIKGETAIPTGTYEIIYTFSPKFKMIMPLLLGIKGFDAVRIHAGNTNKDTEGCVLVGKNNVVGKLTESKITFIHINEIIKAQIKKNNKVYLCIK